MLYLPALCNFIAQKGLSDSPLPALPAPLFSGYLLSKLCAMKAPIHAYSRSRLRVSIDTHNTSKPTLAPSSQEFD